jgi:hypothetical protein
MIKFVFKSANVKTGPIPVSITESATCPDTCAFKNKGCYAKTGPLGWQWKKAKDSWAHLISCVRSLPQGQLWRHNQAGDLPGKNLRINFRMLQQLVKANEGRKGFTYTHKPVTGKGKIAKNNLAYVKYANENGFTVNLSADNISAADSYMKLGVAPVVCVVDSSVKENFVSPAGNRVLICPATQKEYVTCQTCKICQFKNRDYIIAFPAHGTAKKTVNEIIK